MNKTKLIKIIIISLTCIFLLQIGSVLGVRPGGPSFSECMA